MFEVLTICLNACTLYLENYAFEDICSAGLVCLFLIQEHPGIVYGVIKEETLYTMYSNIIKANQ